MPVLLLLLLGTQASASTVTLTRAELLELLPPRAERPPDPPGPRVVRREVRLVPRDDALELVAQWWVDTDAPGWFTGRLTGTATHVRSATWQGRELQLTADGGGAHITEYVTGPARIELRGWVPGEAHVRPVPVELLHAPRGTLVLDTELSPVISVPDSSALAQVGAVFWTGSSNLGVELRPRQQTTGSRPRVVVGTVGLGLTVGNAELTTRAHVGFRALQGELEQVAFSLPGAGADLEVEGAEVASWRRSGDRVEVALREPETRVSLSVSWTTTVPSGEEASLSVPAVRPEGAFRTETALQIASDRELEVVPELDGWEGVASAALPAWGRDLVEGTAQASYTTAAPRSGTLALYRFKPASGPPTFVDMATITGALTRDGRALVKASYAIRNDRGATLGVVPPAGMQIVGARVSGETARVSRGPGDAWRIPLSKSVETVEGLLSFPVEVVLLGDSPAWGRRELRAVALPTVDAPVAVTRVTLHLPPEYDSRLRDGDGDHVAAFTEGQGISYGFGVGDTEAAGMDVLFNQAVGAWMSNDFDEAQGFLDELTELGGANENIRRLQANLDLVQADPAPTSGKKGNVALERRVKEQAKARAVSEANVQTEVLDEAEQSFLAGDYEKAEESYKQALEIGEKLGKLEQAESVDRRSQNEVLKKKLEVVERQRLAQEEVHRELVEEERKREEAAAAHAHAAAEEAAREVRESEDAPAAPLPVASTSELLTKDVLEKIPSGRSYQTATTAPAPEPVFGRDRPDDTKKPDKPTDRSRASVDVDFSFEDITLDGALAMPEEPADTNVSARATLQGAVVELAGMQQVLRGLQQLRAGVPPDQQACLDELATELRALLGTASNAIAAGQRAGADRERVQHEAAKVASARQRASALEERGQLCTGTYSYDDDDVYNLGAPMARVSRERPGFRIGGRGRKNTSGGGAAPAEISVALDDDMDKAPVVHAAQLSAIIPTLGTPVRYEHLLLPAGEELAVEIHAKRSRR